MRMAAGVEYDGRSFHGWQRQTQAGLRTVQGEVERALSRLATHDIKVFCAGRTDAGVHALGQVIHFDTTAKRTNRAWVLGTNALMPDDAKLRWARPVEEHFHARFLAVGRSYRYLIHNRSERSAMWHGRAAEWPVELDVEKMNQAAALLHGVHDFSSFRGRDCQAKSPIKLMRQLSVSRRGHWVIIDIEASGFLHNMVRNITGSLLAVGSSKRPVEWMQDVLDAKDRRVAGESAPAHGLYFMHAQYEDEFELPAFSHNEFPL